MKQVKPIRFTESPSGRMEGIEGRAASKSQHEKFGYFLSMSLKQFLPDIIPNSAVGIFPQKQKEQRQKQLGY
jgi:hypothetical protein